jgi:hypothetical protein
LILVRCDTGSLARRQDHRERRQYNGAKAPEFSPLLARYNPHFVRHLTKRVVLTRRCGGRALLGIFLPSTSPESHSPAQLNIEEWNMRDVIA